MHFYFFVIFNSSLIGKLRDKRDHRFPRPDCCGCNRGQAKLFAFVAAFLVKLLRGAMQAKNTVHAVILYNFLQKRLGVHFPFLDNHNIANKKHKRIEPLIKLTNWEICLAKPPQNNFVNSKIFRFTILPGTYRVDQVTDGFTGFFQVYT